MTPSPHPSTASLQPLNPTTTTTTTVMDYCLCSCFLQLTRLVVKCESQQQFDLITGPHKRFWFPCTSHFHLLVVFGFSVYCLFVYSAQALCACSVSSSQFLVNFKRHLEAWNMNYSVFSRSQWIHLDANILETIPGKMEKKKDCFGTCGHGIKQLYKVAACVDKLCEQKI